MPDSVGEPLSQAKFEFKTDKLTGVLVESISGMKLTIPLTNSDAPVGVTEGGKVNRQAAPSAVESQDITIKFVTSSKNPKAVSDWFYDSHSTPDVGGATKTKGATQTATVTLFKQDGKASAQWEFKGVMPLSYEMSALDAGGSETLTETVTFAYEYFLRKK